MSSSSEKIGCLGVIGWGIFVIICLGFLGQSIGGVLR